MTTTDSAGRGMRPDDLTRIRFVSDPRISPDGRRVAYVVTTLSEEKDEYLWNIWLVEAEGGARRFSVQLGVGRGGRRRPPPLPRRSRPRHRAALVPGRLARGVHLGAGA